MDDEHFLSRLDRLDALEVEDALALYYDPALVRQLLAHAPERGHGDRGAISMADPREGPFIVVTQAGDFVSALARGMSVGTLPVVPRAVWHAARRDQELARDMFAKATELSRGKTRALRRELFGRGPWVSREVMNVMVSLGKLHSGGQATSGALPSGLDGDLRRALGGAQRGAHARALAARGP